MSLPGRYHSSPTSLAASVAALALAVTGCSRVDSTGGDGYVTADRSVLVIAEEDRGAPVTGVSGTTIEGEPFDLAEARRDGAETVVNVWGSWCPPCRAETDDLVAAKARMADDDVLFVGINVRDTPSKALAFSRSRDVTWPSLDDPGARSVLAFRDVPSAAIPTTWVLDGEGRIGARIVDEVDAPTLIDVVADVRAGDVSSDGSDG